MRTNLLDTLRCHRYKCVLQREERLGTPSESLSPEIVRTEQIRVAFFDYPMCGEVRETVHRNELVTLNPFTTPVKTKLNTP